MQMNKTKPAAVLGSFAETQQQQMEVAEGFVKAIVKYVKVKLLLKQ